jgi:HPt (histidine-containing phosphotransfer) domain-containing protein
VTSNAPIDFAHLSRYTLNDRALEAEILDLFVEQLPQSLTRLREARCLTEWRSAAHTIKGSARAVGALKLAEAAAAAEAMPTTGDGRCDLIERVVREIERAVTFVCHAHAAEH